MYRKLKKIFLNPSKALRYIWIAIKKRVFQKKGLLIMVGVDPSGELDILYRGYKKCYVFEANPVRYRKLKRKYSKKANIKIYNFALTDYDGEIDFNISSNNDGASSSIGTFHGKWQGRSDKTEISMIEKIKVPCINLYNFCEKNDINYIDDYISDIQGMDLTVLKTMQPFIEDKKIGSIKCEVTKDEYGNIYEGLPDNSESGFEELLNDKYKLVSKGFGLLEDNKFEEVPDEVWEMDCKWKPKK